MQSEAVRSRNIKNINVFLDAGTTIAEIFPFIVSKGIKMPFTASLNIYTNNLAGIIELHRQGDPKSYVIKEENIHLLGGQPLYDYQAVTGKETEKAIESFCGNKDSDDIDNLSSLNIGIITSNWIMAGIGLDEIRLAARGNGHLCIKKTILKHADYIYIVAPLAKIIRTHDLIKLNEIVPHKDKYSEHRIEIDKRETTILLTTKRSSAPLNITTIALSSCVNDNNNKNYRLSEHCPDYRTTGTKEEIEIQEFPQDYIRNNKDLLYNINS